MSYRKVVDRGVYHGLPTYDENIQGLTAIVTGANGISGQYMARVLGEAPRRWSKIYCLSRNKPTELLDDTKVFEHISVDFLRPSSEIASILTQKNVSADHVFFMSYVQPPHRPDQTLWSEVEELCRLNASLLSNFTEALALAKIQPRRFILQTGAKNYGGHIGPNKVPQEESDPRHGGQRNFYFDQEDILFDYCTRNKLSWSICLPGPILGAVPNASMTLAFPLAVFAAVCGELNLPMEFPSDIPAWQTTQSMTSAKLNAYMAEWVSLHPRAANEKFNICDTSVFTWEKTWPTISRWYGISWKGPRETDQWIESHSWGNHRGYGGKSVMRASFRVGRLMESDDARRAWQSLQRRHDLKPLKDMVSMFAFLDGMIQRSHPVALSMDKSRTLGWSGFVDTMDSLFEVLQDLVALRMIPPLKVVSRA